MVLLIRGLKMKKLYAVIFAFAVTFAISGAANAGTFIYGTITSPADQVIGNSVGDPVDGLPVGAGSFSDDHLFSIDVASSFSEIAGSTSASGAAFSALNSALYRADDFGGWTFLASHTGVLLGGNWVTSLSFSPLDPSPEEYKLVISGVRTAVATAAYGGVLSVAPVTPVPEPEIYAMMAAGLGLMGFVARRRQRNGAVA